MMTLSIVSLLFGAVLGHRFNVLALAPAFLIVLILVIAIGFARAETAWSIVLMAASAVASVQIGYFMGVGVRYGLAAALPNRSPEAPHTTSARRRAV
jgi:uncharacterized membrane protein